MAPPPSDPTDPAPPFDEHDALPAGTRFGELEIVRVLGVGGFGIVYLAHDHALERPVALKEYMPGTLAGRGQGRMVSIRSGAHTETYALGLRSFVNEARLLARFNHPSLVKVYRFWEENGTAYMVMPYLQGRTLRDVRRAMTTAPTEAWMRSVINPLLDALAQLHREDVFHRDIAPDNILLPPGELPVLLDFGAARRAIGDRTQTFTAILKPSYAPIEQYAEVVQLRQGPWTDLYALGAVVYYLLRGMPPPPATARAVQDEGPLLDAQQHADVSPQFIAAVEWALSVRPGDRPQSVDALREVLDGRAAPPRRSHTGTTAPLVVAETTGAAAYAPTVQLARAPEDDTVVPTRPLSAPPRTMPRTAAQASARMPASPPASRPDAPPPPRRTAVEAAVPPAARGLRVGWLAAGFALLLALAAGAAWLVGGRAAPQRVVAQPAEIAPAQAGIAARPAAAEATPAVDTATAPVSPPASANASLAAANPPAVHQQRAGVRGAARASAPLTSRMPQERASPADAAAPQAALPSTAARDLPATPREACGGRVFVALALCMEEQCGRPRFRGHPQCKKVHELLERRRRGETGD